MLRIFVIVSASLLLAIPDYAKSEELLFKHSAHIAIIEGTMSYDLLILKTKIAAKHGVRDKILNHLSKLSYISNMVKYKDDLEAASVVLTERNIEYVTSGRTEFNVVAVVKLDTSKIKGQIAKCIDDRIHLELIKEILKYEKNIIAQLNKTIHQSTKTKLQMDEFFSRLKALVFHWKAMALWENKSYIDEDVAVYYLTESIALNPKYFLTYVSRGIAYLYIGMEYEEKALMDFDQSISLNNNYAYSYYYRGRTYSSLGLKEEPINDYTTALEINPRLSEAYYGRGMLVRNSRKAIEDFTLAILYKNNYAKAYNARGVAYLKFDENEKGCSDFIKGCDLGRCRFLKGFIRDGTCQSD